MLITALPMLMLALIVTNACSELPPHPDSMPTHITPDPITSNFPPLPAIPIIDAREDSVLTPFFPNSTANDNHLTDLCPTDATKTFPGQCGCNMRDNDQDGDEIADCVDKCINFANPMQLDSDGDGIGNDCDNCPTKQNPDQHDIDHDGAGNACDNCPFVANPSLSDSDHDGVGDMCDNCLNLANPDQIDNDKDNRGAACECDDHNPDVTFKEVIGSSGIQCDTGAPAPCNAGTYHCQNQQAYCESVMAECAAILINASNH